MDRRLRRWRSHRSHPPLGSCYRSPAGPQWVGEARYGELGGKEVAGAGAGADAESLSVRSRSYGAYQMGQDTGARDRVGVAAG